MAKKLTDTNVKIGKGVLLLESLPIEIIKGTTPASTGWENGHWVFLQKLYGELHILSVSIMNINNVWVEGINILNVYTNNITGIRVELKDVNQLNRPYRIVVLGHPT